MPSHAIRHSQPEAILAFLERPNEASIAVIAGVVGPSYRPLGTIMTVFENGQSVGSLSGGCIDADVAAHSREARKDGALRHLRYGEGSVFVDMRLPCGGGLDILLLPKPNHRTLEKIANRIAKREDAAIEIDLDSGALSESRQLKTARVGQKLHINFEPALRFVVFGTGLEASTFAAMSQSAGYATCLLSPDEETLETAKTSNCAIRYLASPNFPEDVDVDHRTGVILFFHDHDWEPQILMRVLASPAYYIGALGSRRAHQARLTALSQMGVDAAQLSRINGPAGLIPSARDPSTLAVSVLAEALAKAMPTSK